MRSLLNNEGMTLIEVLVALAIVAIAMTAVIKATSTSTEGAFYLQEKTQALWLAEQVVNEAKVGITVVSEDTISRETDYLGHTWYWTLSRSATSNPRIWQLVMRVYADAEKRDAGEDPLVELQAYQHESGEGKADDKK